MATIISHSAEETFHAGREAGRLRILWPRKFPKLPLTEIGELTEAHGKGKAIHGYDHFA